MTRLPPTPRAKVPPRGELVKLFFQFFLGTQIRITAIPIVKNKIIF